MHSQIMHIHNAIKVYLNSYSTTCVKHKTFEIPHIYIPEDFLWYSDVYMMIIMHSNIPTKHIAFSLRP